MGKNARKHRQIAVLTAAALFLGIIGTVKPVTTPASALSDTVVESGADGTFGYVRVIDRRTGESAEANAGPKNARQPKAASATPAPYADSEVDTLGSIMAEQMRAAFGNSAGTAATFNTVSATELASINDSLNQGVPAGERVDFVDIVSKIDFHIPTNKLPASVLASGSSQSALYYLEQAISRYPDLCCLFTMAYLTITNTAATLTVYSPVATTALASTTTEYKNRLTELLKVPQRNASSMSDIDRILYVHDEVVTLGEYSTGRIGSFSADYAPVGVMLYSLGVCQSYAAVFNQAVRSLGINSYVLDSATHAWNAVYVNSAWYYVDTTWDDTRSFGQDMDFVRHDYLLVNEGAFSDSHTLTSEYALHFPGLADRLGSAFDDYYPKKYGITSQMCYLGGYFYFSTENKVKRWNRANQLDTFDQIPVVSSRRVAVMDGLLYVSGSDGMYQSDYSLAGLNKVSNTPYTGMYEAANRLFVSEGSSFYIFLDASSQVPGATTTPGASLSPLITPTPYSGNATAPVRTATPTPTKTPYSNIPTVPPIGTRTPSATVMTAPPIPTNTPVITPNAPTVSPGTTALPTPGASYIPLVTFIPTTSIPITTPTPYEPVITPTDDPDDETISITKPPRTTIIKVKNIKTRTVRLKWETVPDVSKYQIQYSPSQAFSTRQAKNSLTNSVSITNLYKNKTYYFRVRAVRLQRGSDGIIYYKYAKWSKVRKKTIKK